jgi:hypothetical protein
VPLPQWFQLGTVVLFGDSRTGLFPSICYPYGSLVENVGVGGTRIDLFSHGVIAVPPDHVWWHLGVNDCVYEPSNVVALAATFKGLIDTHAAEYPAAMIHVQTCVPVGAAHATAARTNGYIAGLNALIKVWPALYHVVDVDSIMSEAGPGGFATLKAAYTTDQTHYTQAGNEAQALALGWRLA